MGKKLTKREEDYSKWYNELVVKADLAENSSVRGCMVIKPYGYAIWEKMQNQLDQMFKDTGHQNAYFPLFVPKSLFEAEEKNADFAVLGSVKKTLTHPDLEPMGWVRFNKLVNNSNLPIYSIGGMTNSDVLSSLEYGGIGIASQRAIWAK